MDAAALEQTLREHPGDLAAWLVYGDWLLEHGDARGALIQLEQRLERARAADREPLRRETRRKIDALVQEHQAAWGAELPPGVAVRARRYGFATKVAVEWSADAPALIEQALRDRFVTALRITAPAAGDDQDDELDEVDPGDLPIPPPLVELGPLAALDLSRLVELDLAYVHLGTAGAEALAAAAQLGPLAALDLRYGRIGDAGLAALAASAVAGRLRRLHLQRNALTAAGVPALQRFGGLVELDLRYNELGAAGARALLAAPFIGALARLQLYRADVSDAGAQELARSSRLPLALRSTWSTP